jgi:hypothetical protein
MIVGPVGASRHSGHRIGGSSACSFSSPDRRARGATGHSSISLHGMRAAPRRQYRKTSIFDGAVMRPARSGLGCSGIVAGEIGASPRGVRRRRRSGRGHQAPARFLQLVELPGRPTVATRHPESGQDGQSGPLRRRRAPRSALSREGHAFTALQVDSTVGACSPANPPMAASASPGWIRAPTATSERKSPSHGRM